jgi:hypothetical protein
MYGIFFFAPIPFSPCQVLNFCYSLGRSTEKPMTIEQFLNILTAEVNTINGNVVYNVSYTMRLINSKSYIHLTYENDNDEYFALIDVKELKKVNIPSDMNHEISIVANTNTDDPSTLEIASYMLAPMPIQDLFN